MRAIFEAVASNLLLAANPEYLYAIEKTVEILVRAFQNGRKLMVYGNGGSAADAQHIAAELVGRFLIERQGLPAIALPSNQSLLTAWGNDHGFDTVFQRQIQAFGKPGDVAWGISTSGNSQNVIRAHESAREMGITTIGLTGAEGAALAKYCDILLAVPLTETPRIQEVHLVTYHSICACVEQRLFGHCGTP